AALERPRSYPPQRDPLHDGRHLGSEFFFSSRRRHTRSKRDWSSDVCSSDLVCTVLPAPERPRLDAAGDGCFTTVHTGSFRDALRAARRKRVDALVLSVHACRGDELPAVARFVREFPAIPAVALVSRHDRNASETLLRLGATGVRSAVDCTEPAGWRRLRDLVGHPASPVAARILARVVPALDEGSGDVRAFFEAVARLAPVLSTVRRLARHLRICSST